MNPSTAHATVIVDELINCGVTDVVLCPGSRSAPLAFALHAADAAGRLRLHMRVDERGAGFLALGFARESGRAAAVATTSGTAVANLHPAVLEAHHGAVPLLVLSADRPPHLRGVGANQVIDQNAVFGGGVLRYQHEFAAATASPGYHGYWRNQVRRATAASLGGMTGGLAGPVQLNIPFDVPLVPEGLPAFSGPPATLAAGDVPGKRGAVDVPATLVAQDVGAVASVEIVPGGIPPPGADEKCLVIAAMGDARAALLADAGHLVIAEAGGLAGAAVLSSGVLLLGDNAFVDAHLPERVIVLGRPTLFRAVNRLLARTGVTVDVVDHPACFADLAGTVRRVSRGFSGGVPRVGGVGPVVATSAAASLRAALPADVAELPGRESSVGVGDSSGRAPSPGPLSRGKGAEEWRRAWREADAAAKVAVAEVLVQPGGQDLIAATSGGAAAAAMTGGLAARTVAAALPPSSVLFVGSSQSPRDLARFAAPRRGVRVIANRGVAGIDGSLSTAVGIALSAGSASASTPAPGSRGATELPSASPVSAYALMGDLTFLHDVTALAIGPQEPQPDLTVVVVNNDGGGIFATLEQGAEPFESAFERVFGTPTGVRVGDVAAAFGVAYTHVTTATELAAAVAAPPRGVHIVEVQASRSDLRDLEAEIAGAVRAAVRRDPR